MPRRSGLALLTGDRLQLFKFTPNDFAHLTRAKKRYRRVWRIPQFDFVPDQPP